EPSYSQQLSTMKLLSILMLFFFLLLVSVSSFDSDEDSEENSDFDHYGRNHGERRKGGGRRRGGGKGGRRTRKPRFTRRFGTTLPSTMNRVRPGAEGLQVSDTPIRPDPSFNFFARR
ncbi:hypothetical protein PMAYCL1PPCAC_29100, partial [Pristionchus mayeri]